jgi:hypothetical protein
MILPPSWAVLLETLRPGFARRGTFAVFCVLATGMVAQTSRRSVVGMLAGARMAQTVSFHAACRFFSHAVWDIDRLGLLVTRLIVDRLLGPDEAITVVVDETLFKRWGRKVHSAFWTHDGSAQGKNKIARGNRWAVAGIVVRLPFCTAPVCLPVLFRLWAGKGTASSVEMAGELLTVITAAFPDRRVHGVGDAAYHGKPLLVPGTTWTHDVDDPATGQRRPVRPRPGAHRQTVASRAQGRQTRQTPGPRGRRRLAAGHGAPLRPQRTGLDGRGRVYLVRQLR